MIRNRTPYIFGPGLLSTPVVRSAREIRSIRLAGAQRSATAFVRRHLADSITFMRVVLGLALLSIGLFGKASLAQDIWLVVLAWTTDMVDGRIARAMKSNGRTWLGKNDVYVDTLVSVAVLVYLVTTGLLPLGLAAVYLLVWGLVFWRWGIPPLLAQSFQNPIYAFFLFQTLQAAPGVLPWLLLWAGVGLLFFWKRLAALLRNAFRAMRLAS